MTSSEVVFDIEANGLTPDTIWCLVDSEGTETTSNYTFEEGVTYYAHNGIGYEYPGLASLWGCAPVSGSHNLRDTLVLSRLANPSRAGGHSLSNWGASLGCPKGEHTDWDTYSPAMLNYCKQDVEVTVRVLKQLKQELKGFSEQSIELEHQVARIINRQVNYGWLLNEELCMDLLAELKERQFELEEEVHTTFKPYPKAVREITPKVKKDGTYSTVGLKYYGSRWTDIAGVHTRIDFPEFNLGSRKQIGEYLVRFGWEPEKFTETGQPIVDEAVLSKVQDIPEAQLIAEFLMVQKRIAQVQSWLEHMDDDGRVRGYVNSNGAVTGRMTHSSPNVAQVPAGNAPYGERCRAAWTVPEGRKLVGCDASGLELRMLAHYMNDDDYTKEVLDGDIHTANQTAAGLSERNQAKTFIYAFLYGAGDAKIGSIVGGGATEGKRLKAKFLRNTPALATLRDRVAEASQRGWLKGLDGRRIYVRSSHAALNTLLQGAGAVVMKQALVHLDTMAKAHGLDYEFVGNIHDEMQAEVAAKDAEAFGKLAAYSIVRAGKTLNLRCPLAAEYQIGDNWSETH